jgi:glucose/arabinose dehydrogenase
MSKARFSLLFLIYLFSENGYSQAPALQLQSITQTRLTNPTFVANANDGRGRMFILEQGGRILVVPRGSSTATVFLDLTDRVLTSTERGLLGLAFHRGFGENRRFFVYYTRKPDGAIVVAEYHASASDPDVADKQDTLILAIDHPNAEHNGGMLEFGNDGFLYISVGDGGPGNDPSNHAQDLNSLLGKILRIDIDHPANANVAYSSPRTNPFYGSKPGRDEIYAYGFRNPWRFSFDPVTEELYVGDVGQDAVEEIDVVESGGNYGWRVFEGWRCTNLGPAPCSAENFINPIHAYVHTGRAGRCSITGGYVYRGNKQTLPFGAYVFGDYCTGEILMLYRGEEKLLLRTTKRITAFGVDEDGELYVAGGTVDRIVNSGIPFTPTTSFTIAGGGGVSFDTAGTNDQVTVGHAQIHPNDESTKPAGLAFIALRSNGILVNEAAVPATSLIANGRFYAEVNSTINTGVAIANPNMAQPAAISFQFTDSVGNNAGEGLVRIPPGGQLAAFLDQDPFYGPSIFNGSVSFNSTIPVSVVALRGIVNERSDFLTTTLPVLDLESIATAPVVVPHLAIGGGWTTEILLLNPTDDIIRGTVLFLSPEGRDQTVPVDGIMASSVAYVIPAGSSLKMRTGEAASALTGSYVVTPDREQAAPSVATVYLYAPDGLTVSAAGSATIPTVEEFEIYAQVEGPLGAIGSIQTGVAIANPGNEPASVNYELVRLDGTSAGMTGKLTIGPKGQTVSFIRELPGASDLLLPFQGLLRLSSSTPIAALAIRARYNERGEFLLSATPPAVLALSTGTETFIPQIVDGAGYSTEIVIYDLLKHSPLSGNLYFFDQGGQPINPDWR